MKHLFKYDWRHNIFVKYQFKGKIDSTAKLFWNNYSYMFDGKVTLIIFVKRE